MSRKVYDQEFKETIISLLNAGKTVSELCSEYGISQATINRWRKHFNHSSTSKTKEDIEKNKRIKALEKELKRTQLERDILKKAVSIFSKSDR